MDVEESKDDVMFMESFVGVQRESWCKNGRADSYIGLFCVLWSSYTEQKQQQQQQQKTGKENREDGKTNWGPSDSQRW